MEGTLSVRSPIIRPIPSRMCARDIDELLADKTFLFESLSIFVDANRWHLGVD